MNPTNEMVEFFSNIYSAITKIEAVIRSIRTKENPMSDTQYTRDGYDYNQDDLKRTIATFEPFMPIYSIKNIVDSVNETKSEIPLMIVEMNIDDYRILIDNIPTIEEAYGLKSALSENYYKNTEMLCDKRINKILISTIETTDNLSIIEETLPKLEKHSKESDFGIKRAITFYEKDLIDFSGADEVEAYVDDIKKRGIDIESLRFIQLKMFISEIIEPLLLKELESVSDDLCSITETTEIRKKAEKYDVETVVTMCDAKILKQINQCVAGSDEDVFKEMYKYCPDRFRKHFLDKWISIADDSSLNIILIYRDYALHFSQKRIGLYKAKQKLIKLFKSASYCNDSTDKICQILKRFDDFEIDHNHTLRNVFNQTKEIHDTIVKVISTTNRLDKDDITLFKRITESDEIITCLIRVYLKLHPSTKDIQRLESSPLYFGTERLVKLSDDIGKTIADIFKNETVKSKTTDDLSNLFERAGHSEDNEIIIGIKQQIITKAFSII